MRDFSLRQRNRVEAMKKTLSKGQLEECHYGVRIILLAADKSESGTLL